MKGGAHLNSLIGRNTKLTSNMSVTVNGKSVTKEILQYRQPIEMLEVFYCDADGEIYIRTGSVRGVRETGDCVDFAFLKPNKPIILDINANVLDIKVDAPKSLMYVQGNIQNVASYKNCAVNGNCYSFATKKPAKNNRYITDGITYTKILNKMKEFTGNDYNIININHLDFKYLRLDCSLWNAPLGIAIRSDVAQLETSCDLLINGNVQNLQCCGDLILK